jgi:hypothetical protein
MSSGRVEPEPATEPHLSRSNGPASGTAHMQPTAKIGAYISVTFDKLSLND